MKLTLPIRPLCGLVVILGFSAGCTSGSGPGAFVLGDTGLAASPTPSSSPQSSPGASPSPTPAYAGGIMNDGPTFYWRLGETSGTTFTDIAGGNSAVEAGIPSLYMLNVPGAIVGDTNGAFGLAGSYLYTSDAIASPDTFSLEFWFQNTSPGGRIIGFGDAQAGGSTTFDRHVYMDGTGHLVFGVYDNSAVTITSSGVYSDGKWHYAVATCCGTNAMLLYVDGVLVASGSVTPTENYAGYWRFGYDSLIGWPDVNKFLYDGNLDEIAVYGKILTPTQITDHYRAAQ